MRYFVLIFSLFSCLGWSVTKKPSWQQGFAKVYSDKEHFNLHHYYINQGKCIYNGDIYQGVDYTNNIKELLSV